MTGVEAIKNQWLKDNQWWGYQMSENIDWCLKMTGGEAIKYRCLNMTGALPFLSITRSEAIKSRRISLDNDRWRGYQTLMLEDDRGPSPFCWLHVHLVARLSKTISIDARRWPMLEDDQWRGRKISKHKDDQGPSPSHPLCLVTRLSKGL